MSTVNFVVRDGAGAVQRGAVDTNQMAVITPLAGSAVSLNLRPDQIVSYTRDGKDLKILLSDGSEVVVANVFMGGETQQVDIYVSANGVLHRVAMETSDGPEVVASYAEAQNFGKWSPEDDLFFVRGNELELAELAQDEEVGMLGTAPLLGGLSGLGPLGVVAGVLAGGTLIDGGGTTPPEPEVAITGGVVSAGVTVNADDYADGVTVTGTGTPGAAIVVTTAQGASQNAVVDADGAWSVTFSDEEISGGTYETDVSVTLTDGLGKTAQADDVIALDTETVITINTDIVETDGVVNAAERSDGVPLTGTSEAGATVDVVVNGTTYTTIADADGAWQVELDPSDVPTGETVMPVSATATDAYGNTATTSGNVTIDTTTFVSVDDENVERGANDGDRGVINNEERADGVPLDGKAEANSSVVVTVNGNDYATTADADGNWTVDLNPSDIPTGETTMPVTVRATDSYGNTAEATGEVQVDTYVNLLNFGDDVGAAPAATPFAARSAPTTIINAQDVVDGYTFAGQVEANSTVAVSFNGKEYPATVIGENWSVTIPEADMQDLDGNSLVTLNATDAAGNTRSMSKTVAIDTTVPDAPETAAMLDEGQDVSGLQLASAPADGESINVHSVNGEAGTVAEVSTYGSTIYGFVEPVSDGEDLIVTATEADSGNSASTLFVSNDTQSNNVVVNTDAMQEFEIMKIDLDVADNANLTLTETQVRDLAKTSDNLVIDGGSDDAVTLSGATATGVNKTIDDREYVEYDFGGSDVSVYVDSDVNVSV